MADANYGYAVETEDGQLIKVQNLSTAKYFIQQGLAARIFDLVLRQYLTKG
jgi:hypothetical protein